MLRCLIWVSSVLSFWRQQLLQVLKFCFVCHAIFFLTFIHLCWNFCKCEKVRLLGPGVPICQPSDFHKMQMECNWNSRAGHSLTTALGAFVQSSRAGPRWGAAPRWSVFRDDLKTKTRADIPCYLWSCQKKSYQRQTGELATWSTGPSLGPPCREHTRWHWTSR